MSDSLLNRREPLVHWHRHPPGCVTGWRDWPTGHRPPQWQNWARGDGVLTRRLLDRMAPDTQLDAWEIQPELVGQLRSLAEHDHRLQVISRSAERLERHYDVIFSCLPLLSIPVIPRLRILNRVRERLNPGGVFIQFQYSPLSEKLLSRYFEWTRVYEVRNIPPAWIYVCTPHRKNTV